MLLVRALLRKAEAWMSEDQHGKTRKNAPKEAAAANAAHRV
jgi:hypothetical protein